jgi:spore coat polysaccharide biosynthesis protein SpsF
MKRVALIQARLSSSRLPGKVLMSLGPVTMLAAVVTRLRRARSIDEIVIATSVEPTDEPLVDEAARLGVRAYRGSLHDVLGRFVGAARHAEADVVVRITADCPLIDPHVVDRAVDTFCASLSTLSPCDYLSNTLQRSFPRGLDTEVMTHVALLRAHAEATEPFQREHVTPYLYAEGAPFRVCHLVASHALSMHRWTVDTPADFGFMCAIFALLGDRWEMAGYEEVVAQIERRPEVPSINRDVQQKGTT